MRALPILLLPVAVTVGPVQGFCGEVASGHGWREPVTFDGHRQGTPRHTNADTVTWGVDRRGLLWKPSGEGPFPAVFYSHGSGDDYTDEALALGTFFSRQGFVFFMPYRSGSGLSKRAGPYILSVLDSVGRVDGVEARNRRMVGFLTGEHLDDARSALRWFAAQSFVDSSRVVAAGNSFGGVTSMLLATEPNLPLKAVINSAGAAQTWGPNPFMRDAMIDAARRARVPILLMQAENDYDLTPSRVLHRELQQAGKPVELRFFGPFGTTTAQGHSFGYFGSDIWGATVLAFIRRFTT